MNFEVGVINKLEVKEFASRRLVRYVSNLYNNSISRTISMNLTLEAQPKVNIKNKLSIGMQFLSGIEGYLEREREKQHNKK